METETIFRKVSVNERLPKENGWYPAYTNVLDKPMLTGEYRYGEDRKGFFSMEVTDWLEETTLPDIIQEKDREIGKLKAFKDYVHDRLDKMNVPTHPEGEHSKHGCRIGDRLDIIDTQIQELKGEIIGFTEWIRQEVYLIQAEKWVQLWKSDTATPPNNSILNIKIDNKIGMNKAIQILEAYLETCKGALKFYQKSERNAYRNLNEYDKRFFENTRTKMKAQKKDIKDLKKAISILKKID